MLVPPWECGRGKSMSKEAYFLALARLESACEALNETRIVGQNKDGCGFPPPFSLPLGIAKVLSCRKVRHAFFKAPL